MIEIVKYVKLKYQSVDAKKMWRLKNLLTNFFIDLKY